MPTSLPDKPHRANGALSRDETALTHCLLALNIIQISMVDELDISERRLLHSVFEPFINTPEQTLTETERYLQENLDHTTEKPLVQRGRESLAFHIKFGMETGDFPPLDQMILNIRTDMGLATPPPPPTPAEALIGATARALGIEPFSFPRFAFSTIAAAALGTLVLNTMPAPGTTTPTQNQSQQHSLPARTRPDPDSLFGLSP